MSKTSERVAGYVETFRNERAGHSLSQLEAEKAKVLRTLEELADAEEFHSFVYAEMSWRFDVLEMIIEERNAEATSAYETHTVNFHTGN